MTKTYKQTEEDALSWLKDKLDEGRIVFKKNELKESIYRYLKNKNHLTVLYANYIFLKKEEDPTEVAFKLYYWKILIQFLNLRFRSKNPSWYISGSYPYEFMVGKIKIPEAGEQISIQTKAKTNTVIKLINKYHVLLSTDRDFNNKTIVKKNILGDEAPVLKDEFTIINSSLAKYKLFEENIVSYLNQGDFDSEFVLEYFRNNNSPVLLARMIGAMDQAGNQIQRIKLKEILDSYESKVTIENPFSKGYTLSKVDRPAYLTRFSLSLEKAKLTLSKIKAPKRSSKNFNADDIDSITIDDTYHNLTIEGYDITREIIAKLQAEPASEDHSKLRNLSAAKGFMRALTLIKSLSGTNYKFNRNLTETLWRQLWSPSLNAGIDLSIYRSHMVSIRGASYVPPNHEKIYELLDEFYAHANDFDNGYQQGIFLHYFYVSIHPHGDGNGRISRFLMNLAFIKDKYKWLTIPAEDRRNYFKALEKSQLEDDISYFAEYILNKAR